MHELILEQSINNLRVDVTTFFQIDETQPSEAALTNSCRSLRI